MVVASGTPSVSPQAHREEGHNQPDDGQLQLLETRVQRPELAPPPRRSFQHLAPLRVVQFPELELRRGIDRVVELRRFHRPQPPRRAVVVIRVAGEQGLAVGDVQPAVIEPDRDALARQAPFGIEVEALDTDVAGAVDQAPDLQLAQRPRQRVRSQLALAYPARTSTGVCKPSARARWVQCGVVLKVSTKAACRSWSSGSSPR